MVEKLGKKRKKTYDATLWTFIRHLTKWLKLMKTLVDLGVPMEWRVTIHKSYEHVKSWIRTYKGFSRSSRVG